MEEISLKHEESLIHEMLGNRLSRIKDDGVAVINQKKSKKNRNTL